MRKLFQQIVSVIVHLNPIKHDFTSSRSEAVVHKCFTKDVLLKILQNSHKNTLDFKNSLNNILQCWKNTLTFQWAAV